MGFCCYFLIYIPYIIFGKRDKKIIDYGIKEEYLIVS